MTGCIVSMIVWPVCRMAKNHSVASASVNSGQYAMAESQYARPVSQSPHYLGAAIDFMHCTTSQIRGKLLSSSSRSEQSSKTTAELLTSVRKMFSSRASTAEQ